MHLALLQDTWTLQGSTLIDRRKGAVDAVVAVQGKEQGVRNSRGSRQRFSHNISHGVIVIFMIKYKAVDSLPWHTSYPVSPWESMLDWEVASSPGKSKKNSAATANQ